MATPWLKAAIAENFGGTHSVTVGGTQIERDETAAPRCACATSSCATPTAPWWRARRRPKSACPGISLLCGRCARKSLNLVGAEMAVRIETDGKVTVFAGADTRPIASRAAGALRSRRQREIDARLPTRCAAASRTFAGVLAWIDGLGATGLDGHDLRELGLKNGNLTVDDQRNGKRWTFSRINVSLTRPTQGGVIFRLESDNPERPWQVSAAMRPLARRRARGRHRGAQGLAQRHPAGDALGRRHVESDLPLSASMRAEFTPDGTLQRRRARSWPAPAIIRDLRDPQSRIEIDHADIRFNWDGAHARAWSCRSRSRPAATSSLCCARAQPADRTGDLVCWRRPRRPGDRSGDFRGARQRRTRRAFALNRVEHARRASIRRASASNSIRAISAASTRGPAYNVGVALTGSLD